MKNDIAILLKLQEMDLDLDHSRQAQDDLAPQREKARAALAGAQRQWDDAKARLTQLQVDRKNLELDIDGQDQTIRKFNGELNNVKNNDAYRTLLAQIEEGKKAKRGLEDRVLEIMETVESLQREVKIQEKALQEARATCDKLLADLDAQEKELAERQRERDAARAAFAESLPEILRATYEKIRRGRAGLRVIVPIQNEHCSGCRMTLPPRVINDVMKGTDLILCESCTRILYLPAPDPVPDSAPAAG